MSIVGFIFHLFFCSTFLMILDELFSCKQRLLVFGNSPVPSQQAIFNSKEVCFDWRACDGVYICSNKKKILSMPHYCEGNRKQKKKLVGISEVMHKCSPFPSLQESFGWNSSFSVPLILFLSRFSHILPTKKFEQMICV